MSTEAWVGTAVVIGMALVTAAIGWMRKVDKTTTTMSANVDSTAKEIAAITETLAAEKRDNSAEHLILWQAHHEDVKELIGVGSRVTRMETLIEMAGLAVPRKQPHGFDANDTAAGQ